MVAGYTKCRYCGSTLIRGGHTCQSCGAPVEVVAVVSQTAVSGGESRLKTIAEQEEEARKQEEFLKKTASTLEGAYFFFWHSLAQLFAVGISAAALGIIGGATEMTLWGVLGAGLVGAAVGNARKWSLLEMVSAPLGLVLGSALAIIFWLLFHLNAVFVVCATLGAAGMALLGNQQVRFAWRSLWQKMRPLVGLLFGLTIGTLGALVGLAIRAAVMALLNGF
jgi:hypothetical protein